MKSGEQVFYRALRKYGWYNWSWEILYQSTDPEHTLKEMEAFFIRDNNSCINYPKSNGYNMTEGGEGTIGYKHSRKTKKLIGEMLLGKTKGRKKGKRSLRHRLNLSRALKGRTPWNKGIKTGCVPWNKGKTGIYSTETLEQMSRSALDRDRPDYRWWNDGVTDYYVTDDKVQPEWVKDRVFKKRSMKIKTCPHCGYEGSGGNMSRYHFDNCKRNPDGNISGSKEKGA